SLGALLFGTRMPVDWKSLRETCNLRQMIGRVIPGYEQIAAVDQTRQEFHVGGRILHTPRFPTPSGKAKFTVHPLPALPGDATPLRLMTVRSEGQFNTVVYEEEDIYRGQERRDVILMNQHDITRLGLRVDQRVMVKSATGSLSNILVRAFDIRAGNALMYFPQAHVLVPAATAPPPQTPAVNSVPPTLD